MSYNSKIRFVFRRTVLSGLIFALVTPSAANSSSEEQFKSAAAQGKNFGKQASSDFSLQIKNQKNELGYRGVTINQEDYISDSVREFSIFDPSETVSSFSKDNVEEQSEEAKHRLYNQNSTRDQEKGDLSSAYRILTDTRVNFSGIDLSTDPIAQASSEVYSELDQKEGTGGYFSDCSKRTTYSSKPSGIHVPKLVQCNRLQDFSGECSISHSIFADPVVTLVSAFTPKGSNNYLNIMPCEQEENCFVMWVGDQYGQKSNWCTQFDDFLYIKVKHPEAINDVYLSYVGWDDYLAIFLGRNGYEELLYNTTGTLPIKVTSLDSTTNLEAQAEFLAGNTVYVDLLNGHKIVRSPRCENEGEDCFYNRCNNGLSVHQTHTASGTSLTSLFKSTKYSDEPLVLHTVTSTADVGGYQAKLKVYYDPDKVILHNDWQDPECIERARSVDDQFSSGEYYCEKFLDDIFVDPESGENCIISAGVKLCESQLKEYTPLKNISPFCEKVRVKAKTEYFKTSDDEEQYNLDGCAKYRKDCTFVSTHCVPDAIGASGNCYEHEDTYDCGEDRADNHTIAEVAYDCNGMVRCIGTECADDSVDVSDSFARTSALLNAAQFMGQDMECDGVDAHGNPTGDKNISCKVFAGVDKSCSVSMKGLGGLEVNCCESPGGISPAEYIAALMYLPKLDSMIARTGPDSMIYGAYNTIREPIFNAVSKIGNTVSDVTKPFVSWTENNFGFTGTGQTDPGITDKVLSILKDKAKEIIKKLIVRAHTAGLEGAGESAGGSALTDEALAEIEQRASEQATAIIDGVGNCLTVVGYVYMAYQIASLASQMIFKCTDEQLQLAGQKQLGNCSYVGQYCSKKVLRSCVQKTFSYCCYSSPLSRIIQEQIHNQLGMPISSLNPRNPDCGGINTDQLDMVDWSALDLSEWTSLLKITGNYPEASEITIDSLTGKGSRLNLDYSSTGLTESERLNATERATERIFSIDVDKVNRDANTNTPVDLKGDKTIHLK